MLYDWAGSRILKFSVVEDLRRLRMDGQEIRVDMDVRQWLTPSDCSELRKKTKQLFEPPGQVPVGPMSYDRRAWLCWKYVVDNFHYSHDGNKDFWQLPQETMARRCGDCEDLSFLLASLLLVGLISPYCVRVVFGDLHTRQSDTEPWLSRGRHAWVIYKNIRGRWCILDPTIDAAEIPTSTPWMEIDTPNVESFSTSLRQYTPQWCCNRDHAWAIDPAITEWAPGLYRK